MKKLMIFAIAGVVLSAIAFANIVILQDGKITNYDKSSEVTVNGKTTSRVLYDGILITVPKNQKVQISKKDGKIAVSGNNLKDVEIAGKQVSSKGEAIVVVSPETMEVSVVEGDTTIENNEVIFDSAKNPGDVTKVVTKKTVSVAKPQPQMVAKVQVTEPVVFPEISEYVNEIAVQQAVQDIERTDMSQSTTTGA